MTFRNLSFENRLRNLEITTSKDRRLTVDLIKMLKIKISMDLKDKFIII